jgi:hypothetical protein
VFDNQTACTQCRTAIQAKDWTCPRCGAIVAPYLFSTVTRKSLEGDGRKAYEAGYQDCLQQTGKTGSPAIQPERYRPTAGNQTAYRAGWQAATDKFNAKADRKFGRRRGLRVLGSGIALLSIGGAIAFATQAATKGHLTLLVITPLGLGVLNVVLGMVMILTGSNDEARPETTPR